MLPISTVVIVQEWARDKIQGVRVQLGIIVRFDCYESYYSSSSNYVDREKV
jgi:hypothetical protein